MSKLAKILTTSLFSLIIVIILKSFVFLNITDIELFLIYLLFINQLYLLDLLGNK